MKKMKISDFKTEPWRVVAMDAMKRGEAIGRRNGLELMEANAAMLLGLSEIICEMKYEKEIKK